MLLLFEVMSGFKVNFHKSILIGVNVNMPLGWMRRLSCKIGKIPFVYLELSIGGNSRHVLFWEPVLNW